MQRSIESQRAFGRKERSKCGDRRAQDKARRIRSIRAHREQKEQNAKVREASIQVNAKHQVRTCESMPSPWWDRFEEGAGLRLDGSGGRAQLGTGTATPGAWESRGAAAALSSPAR